MLDSNDKFAVLKIGDWGLGRENRSLDGTVTPTVCTLYYRPIEIILGSINLNKNRNDILIDGAQTQVCKCFVLKILCFKTNSQPLSIT